MFGNDSLPSCVYKYGAKGPTLNGDLVNEEISRMHKYRNQLVELERHRREAVEATLLALRPDLAAVEAEVKRLEEAVEIAVTEAKQRNADARNKRLPLAQREAIAALKLDRKSAFTRRKELRAEAFAAADVKAALAEIDKKNHAASVAARAASGLYWGNYMTVEQTMGNARSGAPPKFQRWTGDGKVRVQLQGGLETREAMDGNDKRLQIDAPPVSHDPDWSGNRASHRTVCRVRIGTTADRQPIWAEFPITMHRPLPDGAQIKWAGMIRKRVASHDEWSLQVVVSKAGGFAKPDTATTGMVGIDVGWRMTDAGLRVAYWVGSDGSVGELILPHRAVERWNKGPELQSIRDTHFNGAIDTLARWRDGEAQTSYAAERAQWVRNQRGHNTTEKRNLAEESSAWQTIADADIRTGDLPEWLAERIKTVRLWKAPGKLAALVLHWRENRFDGDSAMFTVLNQWRKRDKHLWEWQVNQGRKALAWRKQIYSDFAAMLRCRYKTVAIEDCNWATLQKNAEVEETQSPGGVKRYMRVAAVGDLLKRIRQSVGETVQVSSVDTTRVHAGCGQKSGEPNPGNLFHTCSHCGATYDQDANAAQNLLRAASGEVMAPA